MSMSTSTPGLACCGGCPHRICTGTNACGIKVGLSRLAPNGHTLCGTIRHRAPRYATRSTRVSWVVTWSSCSCRVRSSSRAASCEAAKQADHNRQVTPATRCTRYQAAYGSKEQSTLVSERQRLRPGIAAFFLSRCGRDSAFGYAAAGASY